VKKIELTNVSKSYGHVEAVKNVSLTFEQHKIYGLLGRNGAGKSTLLNMITSRVFPDSGEITVDGDHAIENDYAMGKIHLMSENNYYPESMRIRDALRLAGALYPDFCMKTANSLAESWGLDTKKKMKELSTGMNTMFKASVALASGAPYIFLDEPVLGLDAVHRDLFYKLVVAQFEKHPACYVLSTHLIEEAAGIIEDVIIINAGEILVNEPTEQLLSQGYTVTGPEAVVNTFIAGRSCIGHDQLGGMKSAYLLEPLDGSQVPDGLQTTKLNLQQLFVQLTKREGGNGHDLA